MKKHLLGSLLLASLFALPSCVVRGSGYVSGPSVAVVEVQDEPPPPRYETYEVRPGYVWIQGNWHYNGRQYVWHNGRYERERVGHVWAPGRWERRGRGHVWVEGRWNAGGGGRNNGPAVRDHRDNRREERRDNGPVIRDHRR